MKQIKSKIEEMIASINERVFLNEASDDSKYPYIVYSLGTGVNLEGLMSYTLDINIWDDSDTTERIDDLEKEIKKLDKTTYIDENVQFTLYFDRIIPTGTKERGIKRNTLIFEVRAIERS